MSSNLHRSHNIAAFLLVSAFACGCADVSYDDQAAPDALAFDGSPELLFEFETPEGDWVAFYETEDGSIASVGRLTEHADPALRQRVEEAARGGDLATLYRALTGGAPNGETLAKLAASDAASLELDAQGADRAPDAAALPAPSELVAEQDAATIEPPLAPELEARQSSDCLQTDAFYNADSSGWAGANCVTTDNIPNVFCRTNRNPSILYDYHRARRFRATTFNQTRCNQASFGCKYKYLDWQGAFPPREVLVSRNFFTAAVGPRQQFFCNWNAGRGDMDFKAEVTDVSGPERAHLCLAANKR